MRISLATSSAAALAAAAALLPLRPADGQGLQPIVVRTDFRNTPGQGRAIAELERQLNLFRDQVRTAERSQQPAFGPFQVEQVPGLERNPLSEWKSNTIAMVWGRADPSSASLIRPNATLFIGPLRVQPMLRRRANSFRTLHSMISIAGGDRDTDMGTYANYVGYAVLLRIWMEQPARAGTIARVLERRIQDDYGGPNGSSPCLDDLLEAVKLIGRRASRNLPPRPDNLANLQSIECNPPGR